MFIIIHLVSFSKSCVVVLYKKNALYKPYVYNALQYFVQAEMHKWMNLKQFIVLHL